MRRDGWQRGFPCSHIIGYAHPKVPQPASVTIFANTSPDSGSSLITCDTHRTAHCKTNSPSTNHNIIGQSTVITEGSKVMACKVIQSHLQVITAFPF